MAKKSATETGKEQSQNEQVMPPGPGKATGEKKRRRTSWKAGQSGNPKGRPRSGEALSEIVREEVTPKGIIKRMQHLADNALSEQVRFHALTWLADRGYGKAPQEVVVHRGNPFSRRVKDLTEAQLLALAALDEPVADSEADGGPPPTGLN